MRYGKARELVESAIEQIDELSKGTYGSYIKRAAANIDYEKTDTNPENEESVEKKVRRRLKGIGRAVKALGGQHRGAGMAYNKKTLGEAAKKKPTKEEKAEAAFQRSLARLSARNAKNQKKYQKAAAANPRANISAHGRPVTKADVAAWHASKPMRSDGLREPYNYMGEAVNAKDLRKKIDLHGNQVQVHSQLYNRTMDPEHRSQVNAHQEAHGKAVKAYKKATGKEYYGKPGKSRNPVYLKTTATHRSARLGAAGQPGGFNW